MSQFTYPWEYNFPPFFTIQPNIETRKAQFEVWRSLLVDYCYHHNLHKLNIRDQLNKAPFYNERIDRRLSLEDARSIIADLVSKRFAEWCDSQKETCLIYTKQPVEWAKVIYKYVKEKSLYNTICTFYELLEGDSTVNYEFHQLDEAMFMKALKILEREGKAAVIEMDGSRGVKFV